jgi:uncharacterized membrane protein YcaP (DUF421 family)
MSSTVFFDGWDSLFRILIVGPIAYAALVALLRLGGKRSLSKMNAFDFVLTIAFGSALATTLLSREVALAEGVLVLALLVALLEADGSIGVVARPGSPARSSRATTLGRLRLHSADGDA